MNALVASKATLTFGWLLVTAAYIGTGDPAAATTEQAGAAKGAHMKIGKQACTDCHGELTSKANMHAVAADCATCHEYSEPAGAAEARVKLVAQGSALCYTCHEDVQKAIEGKKMPHAAAQGDCTTCHTPHSSDVPKLLTAKQDQLCATCHTELGEKIGASKFVHAPVKDQGCSACHNPHASDTVHLQKQETVQLCLSCHALERDYNPNNKTRRRLLATTTFRGHPIKNHPYANVPDPSNPGKTLSCMSCHDPHVGTGVKRLREGKVKNDFCSRCH